MARWRWWSGNGGSAAILVNLTVKGSEKMVDQDSEIPDNVGALDDWLHKMLMAMCEGSISPA